MYMCVRAINLAFFVVVDFIRIWNCSNTVIVFFSFLVLFHFRLPIQNFTYALFLGIILIQKSQKANFHFP